MRLVYRFLLLSSIAVLFYQCQRELSYIGSGDNGDQVVPNPLSANLQGNVWDEAGQPASNVVIKVGNEIAVTDTKGYFRINNAPLDRNVARVTAEKIGYFKAIRAFSATSGTNQVVIKLIKKTVSGTVSANSGGEVSLSNGTKVTLPANGIIRASDNSSYTGTVNVYAAFIDPTAADFLERIPGSLMANDKDGKRVLLASYGMMAVELESASGEKLQIKSGNTATLTSPIPASIQSSAPSTIPLWYVDEASGLWKEEGTASRQGNSYVGTVTHFSYWNCDIPVPTVKFTATFKTGKGEPLVNAQVYIRPATANYVGGSAHGFTDSLGQATGPIPANMNLVMEVLDPCRNVVYTQNIGPYNANVDLGVITLPATTPSVVTVKGKLANCSSANVTNGYAIISINNMVRYAKVDASGNFSTNYVLCNIGTSQVQVVGVDGSAQQQGNVASFAITSPTTDVGTVIACGTSANEYINYSIDGTNYQMTVGDSLLAYSADSTGTARDFTYIMGSKTPNFIQFRFNTTAPAPGNYEMTTLSVQNYFQTTIVQPLNVNLTSYATAAGLFYEGGFTGQFKDAGNVTHNIVCTFRIRRTF